MTATLDDVTKKIKPEPTAQELAAKELVRRAREQGLSLDRSADCSSDIKGLPQVPTSFGATPPDAWRSAIRRQQIAIPLSVSVEAGAPWRATAARRCPPRWGR